MKGTTLVMMSLVITMIGTITLTALPKAVYAQGGIAPTDGDDDVGVPTGQDDDDGEDDDDVGVPTGQDDDDGEDDDDDVSTPPPPPPDPCQVNPNLPECQPPRDPRCEGQPPGTLILFVDPGPPPQTIIIQC